MKEFLKENEMAVYLFKEGTNYQSYDFFGTHKKEVESQKGVQFNVWAPNAKSVRVIGEFNNWNGDNHVMKSVEDTGIWSLFTPKMKDYTLYKYEIHTHDGRVLYKADPFALHSEMKPQTASRVYTKRSYRWGDKRWLDKRKKTDSYNAPMNIYELHLGSWKSTAEDNYRNYRELAHDIVEYVKRMNYTHIEIMPIKEHPFDGSWGYQVTGYFSVTSRYGNPDDFKYFVNYCHKNNIGVILDWVPCHFCKDAHGLYEFDGNPLYEPHDRELSENPQWGTRNFDYGSGGVQSFLISNALFWFREYHIDGLRVDAVAYMLYYQNSGQENQINEDAVKFVKNLNKAVFAEFPDALMIAEESTAWPLVTGPIHDGGLGFNYKWNMGWMNDMLEYMEQDTLHRKWYQNLITFSFMYAFSENFILPLSHDEVVHGKKSLLDKMPGTYEEKFSNLRLFYGYMFGHPGKKLLFMGGEFGHFIEWNYKSELDWFLLDYEMHRKTQNYVKDLNKLYIEEPALYEIDSHLDTFKWIDADNSEYSVIAFMRNGVKEEEKIVVVCNFGTHHFDEYYIGVPEKGDYKLIFNSNEKAYGGCGSNVRKKVKSAGEPYHNFKNSIDISIPALTTLYYKFTPKVTKSNKGKQAKKKTLGKVKNK